SNPQSLVDGDTTTQWGSAPLDSQWLKCNLEQNFLIKRVIVRWGSNYATAWRLWLSPDYSGGTVVRSMTGGSGGTTVIDSINQSGTYVSLSLDTRQSTSTGFVIREFEVYGLAGPLSAGGPGSGIPDHYALLQNYPNPFNPSTTITFALPVQSRVTIAIYNLLGQRVAELLSGEMDTGYHSVVWYPGAASGVYFCRMEAAATGAPGRQFRRAMKLMVLR
ncbi:MAG TPA: T9SS type A sorting domain-containing protein, partial [Bacteroidota bacterium]|nr:T9SS type A sorting domain-containing protein [Bacteroidota bacterium]